MNESLTFTVRKGCFWFHFRYWVSVAMPVVFLGMSIYSCILHGWEAFVAGFSFALVMLPFSIYMYSEKKRLAQAKIEMYAETESIVFHHFRLTSQFLPEPPRDKENVNFSDILGCKFYSTQGGDSLHVRTTKGKVVIPEEMSDFQSLAQIFGRLVEANKSNAIEFEEKSKEEPVIRTPLYGWLILASAVACAAVAGWYFMYRTN